MADLRCGWKVPPGASFGALERSVRAATRRLPCGVVSSPDAQSPPRDPWVLCLGHTGGGRTVDPVTAAGASGLLPAGRTAMWPMSTAAWPPPSGPSRRHGGVSSRLGRGVPRSGARASQMGPAIDSGPFFPLWKGTFTGCFISSSGLTWTGVPSPSQVLAAARFLASYARFAHAHCTLAHDSDDAAEADTS